MIRSRIPESINLKIKKLHDYLNCLAQLVPSVVTDRENINRKYNSPKHNSCQIVFPRDSVICMILINP